MTDIRGRLWLDGDTIVSQRTQDVESILDANKVLQNEPQKRAGSFRHIGTIPAVILERWISEDGVNYLALPKDEFAKLIRRKLRDPQYMWLRTDGGRI